MAIDEHLPQWRDYLALLARADATMDLLADPADPQTRQELLRLLFQNLAAGYLSAFAEPDFPDFLPVVNNIFNSVGVNPDFIYGYARIDGAGAYRLTGTRGTGLFLIFDLAAGGLGVMDEPGPSVGTLNVDSLQLGAGGQFDVLLSATRPASHNGDWFPLDPRASVINFRQASYDWGDAEAARLAIERVDKTTPRPRLDGAEIAQRLTRLAAHPARYTSFALQYCKGQRDRGLVNRLEHDDWAGRGGLAGQHYYQGLFHLQPGQALILETELPERVRYWNVQLNDPLWNTIDWFNHQSSLNGGQALLDPDGKFRAVISRDDPGVPNWLDTGGYDSGSMMLRWTEAGSGPAPSLTPVPLAELREYLPETTPRVSPAPRLAKLQARRRSAQLRRRW